MWDLIVSVPDHCLSFYFGLITVNVFLFLNFQLTSASLGSISVFSG